MRFIKALAVTLILWSNVASAESWGVIAGSGSYMGDRHAGVAVESESQRHQAELTYGYTPGILGEDVKQLNLKYIYSPLRSSYKGFSTNWLGIGAMATYCLCSETFYESPSQYPESNYYDETELRFGLVLSSVIQWKSFEAYFDWTLLDQIAIAASNNSEYAKQVKDVWAGGFGLRYFF